MMTNTTWLAALDAELSARGVATGDRAAAIVETESFITDTAENAFEHFGTPAAYATELAAALGCNQRPEVPLDARVVLDARQVDVAYRRNEVLRDVSVTVRAGTLTALIGPNGAGKSTLLRVLAGVQRPDQGRVERHGSVGYSPQSGGLDDHLEAEQHFRLFGAARGLSGSQAEADGRRLAEQLGWKCEGAGIAGDLSGGTQQKLRVVTAMIGEPDVLLLDEPYQGMDASGAARFWDLVSDWVERGGAAVISSHDPGVLSRAHEVLELEANLRSAA